MTPEDIAKYIKNNTDVGVGVTVGMLIGNAERAIGVYPAKGNGTKICLGGTDQTMQAEYNTTILIHWSRDPVVAEAKANGVFALFFGKTDFYIGNTHVYIADPGQEPICVGKDQYEICEYVINLKLIYKR